MRSRGDVNAATFAICTGELREQRTSAPTQLARATRFRIGCVERKCLRASDTSSLRDNDARCESREKERKRHMYIYALEKVDRIQQCTHTALVWRGRTLRPPAARRSSLPRPFAGESSAAPGDGFRSHPLAHSGRTTLSSSNPIVPKKYDVPAPSRGPTVRANCHRSGWREDPRSQNERVSAQICNCYLRIRWTSKVT